jgi:hypothetical protein
MAAASVPAMIANKPFPDKPNLIRVTSLKTFPSTFPLMRVGIGSSFCFARLTDKPYHVDSLRCADHWGAISHGCPEPQISAPGVNSGAKGEVNVTFHALPIRNHLLQQMHLSGWRRA